MHKRDMGEDCKEIDDEDFNTDRSVLFRFRYKKCPVFILELIGFESEADVMAQGFTELVAGFFVVWSHKHSLGGIFEIAEMAFLSFSELRKAHPQATRRCCQKTHLCVSKVRMTFDPS